jgi:acetyltransferase-like isoleucine patch superfamily enzyme
MIQRIRYFKDWVRGLCFKPFLGTCGKGLRIDKSAFLSGLSNIHLGDNIFINKGCVVQGAGLVFIGSNSLIAPYVQIYSQEHCKEDYKKTISRRIVIGSNCWIGANVIILKGSHIPDNTIVPAGAIVTKGGIICQGYLSTEVQDSLDTILAKRYLKKTTK